MTLKNFAQKVAAAAKDGVLPMQLIPMRKGDLAKGCLIRFRIGSTY